MEPKQQVVSGSTRQNTTPNGMQKDLKHDLWQYALSKENEQITIRVFSLVLCKNFFIIIMVLMAHYDLELHQMDVKMTFHNGHLYENDYMAQPKRFCHGRKEHMGCRLWKSIYGLKVSLQIVVFEVDETMIRKFRFKENEKDNAFIRNSRMENSFSTSCEQMTFYSLVVMLICHCKRRSFVLKFQCE